MDRYDYYTDEQKELRNKLLKVIRESKLPCEESWRVLNHLSDELNNVGQHTGSLFTMDEILTRYEAKLAVNQTE